MTIFKYFIRLILVAACFTLAGCDHINHYTISEDKINHALLKHNDFHKVFNLAGIAKASITLTDLRSKIGRAQPDRISVSAQANVEINWLISKKHAQLQLTMSAKPVLDATQGAIYLQDLSLDQYQLSHQSIDSAFNAIKPMLQAELVDYFNSHPAYVLSYQHRWTESVIKHWASRLEVKPGQLVIYLN